MATPGRVARSIDQMGAGDAEGKEREKQKTKTKTKNLYKEHGGHGDTEGTRREQREQKTREERARCIVPLHERAMVFCR